ncbi:MAG: MBOAT family O-acyltransferase [Deltaproteobacteria bacterium]|nr:MBOAT family O-acyltransferase [Deltaproteobacteria bacterium]
MQPDLLRRLAEPLLAPLDAAVAAAALPGPLRDALTQLLDVSGLLVLAALLYVLRPAATAAWRVPAAAVAAGLGAWLLTHPAARFDDLFLRWDQFAFAAAAGLAAAGLAATPRKLVLAGLSTALLLLYCGPLAVAVVAAVTASGLALHRSPLGRGERAWLAHTALLLAVYAFAFWLRRRNLFEAARLQGLLAFGLLRYVSLMVAAHGAPRPALADCALYMTCYPGITGLRGAPEVYAEFARRNLARPPRLEPRAAAASLAKGLAMLVASAAVPMSLPRLLASASAPEAWACAALFFVKIALAAMGAWRTVDATALCLGIRLRMNFAGLLTCRNPSELWWAWRGTLTNWLVQHVYAPLGAARHHQIRNILAAFAVSFAWHALGVPFLTPAFHWSFVAAIALWAALNALGVVLHVAAGRRRGTARPPGRLRLASEIVAMWGFGALTPILLSYQGPAAAGLPDLLRLLLGVR